MPLELPPPPRKEDARFDNWVFTLWKRAVGALLSGGVGATSPITITTSGTGTVNIGHGTSGVIPGTYGGTLGVPQVVVDTYGHVTAGTSLPLQATAPILLGSNAGTYTWGHSTCGVVSGTYGGSDSIPTIVVDTFGHVTSVTTNTVASASSLTLGSRVVTTSGTVASYTGFPSNTKRVTVIFDQFSMSGTGNPLVQLGDSGGIETNAYLANSQIPGGGVSTSTSGFLVHINTNLGTFTGKMVIDLQNSAANTWIENHVGFYTSSNNSVLGGGGKSLSAAFTQLRVVPSGTDVFDAGSINVSHEVGA